MDIKLKVEGLVEALLLVSKAIDVKATESISSMVYMRAVEGWLFLYSTNSISEVFVKIPADVKEAGEFMIDPTKLRNGLSNPNNDTVRLFNTEKDKNWVSASCGKSKFRLGIRIETLVVAEHIKTRYPLKKEASLSLPADLIRAFYIRSGFCVFEGEHKMSSIRGIRIEKNKEKIKVLATDSRIACKLDVEVKAEGSSLVLPKAISIEGELFSRITSILSKKKEELVEVVIDSPWIYFKMGDIIYSTRMLYGDYPNIDQLFLNSGKESITIEVQPLLNAVKRMSFFLSDSERGSVLLSLNDKNTLELSCEQMKEEFQVETAGIDSYPRKIKIMLDQLTNILSGSASNTINLYLNEDKKPIMFEDHAVNTSHDISVQYVLMGLT